MNRKNFSAKLGTPSHPILLAVCISSALSLSAPVAAAQEATGISGNTSASTELRQYNIPAQPLSEALIEFGKQSGLQVTTGSVLVEGKQAPSVSGTLSAEQALNRLLVGNNLDYKISNGMIHLTANEIEAITLPQVNISGDSIQESAYGPVEGYVAKRSSTATKTDTPIIEIPQSISVTSRKNMDVRNVRDIGDAVAYTAGVLGDTAGEKNIFAGSSIRIRGYSGYSLSSSGASNNIGS